MSKIIKNTIYGSEYGRLDPNVLERTKTKSPIKDKEVTRSFEIEEFDLLKIRSSMGGNNKDLVKGHVREKDIAIPCKDKYLLARLYYPTELATFKNCLLYLHGGGFIGGSIEAMNNQCRLIAERAHTLVVSLNYRLSPESRFPDQYYDAKETINWLSINHKDLNILNSQIYVAGDSAGATLAVACGLTDNKHQIRKIISLYGALDFTSIDKTIYHWQYSDYQICDQEKELIHTRLNKFAILSKLIQKIYIGNADDTNPLVNPVYATDFSNFPPLVMIEAEFDYFLQSNKYFAKLARENKIKVDEVLYKGLDHGFFDRLGILPQAEDAVNVIVKAME